MQLKIEYKLAPAYATPTIPIVANLSPTILILLAAGCSLVWICLRLVFGLHKRNEYHIVKYPHRDSLQVHTV